MSKPEIILEFRDGGVTWRSVGWKINEELMKAAKKAINDGETPKKVLENLSKTFDVSVFS